MFHYFIGLMLLSLQWASCDSQNTFTQSATFQQMNNATTDPHQQIDSATFGGGCFWCTEAQFLQLKGVTKVVSGYMGGRVVHPTYREVCTGTTGHAEVVQVFYDRSQISFDELLAAFFVSHDPTQLNRQGNDIGTQYRSVVFYHNDEQKEKTNDYIKRLNAEKVYPDPIVTAVDAAQKFYPAEDYHQDYYRLNSTEPYCRYVIQPKMEKFKAVFQDKLKK